MFNPRDISRDAISELEAKMRDALLTGDRRWFRLKFDRKLVPWWIRWRPSVRRWLRETEKLVNEFIQEKTEWNK